MKRLFAVLLPLLPLLLLCGCAPQQYSTDFFAMDTFMSVTVLGDKGQAVAQQCEQRVNELEGLLSRTRSGEGGAKASSVYVLNHAPSDTMMYDEGGYIQTAKALSEQTHGLFDPTTARLTDLWGIGTENAHVPAQSEIDETLKTVGAANIQMDESSGFVGLGNGAQLDLGGIAKGIAADACAAMLRDADASGLLMLGGNIYAVGSNGGKPWRIGIADPDNNAEYIATVAVEDQSVVTSGDYERYFEQDGKRYHHIFDPRTGYPADSGLRGVTVIDANSTRADAFTTALFVMGLEDGMAFCKENGVAAVFITADKRVVTSPAVEEICEFSFAGEAKGYIYAQ